MSEALEHYRVIADAFTDRVDGVRPEQWSARTPCTEWTARDLLAHVVAVHRLVMGAPPGNSGLPEIGLEEDLPAAWRAGRDEVAAALADPGRAGATIDAGPLSGQTFEQVIGGLICADTLVHTWDLARATGQDERLDPAEVERIAAFMAPMDEGMRRPGGFAARVEPPAGADEQTRFLCFCGRAV